MTNRHLQRKLVYLAILTVSTLTLSGSCVPTDPAELGTLVGDFTRDLLLNAVAAFLL